jgi:MoxR-like ATPase
MTEGYRFHQFIENGDPDYIASSALAAAVNTALAAEQPLVITGEPGTGKTTLAASIAKQLDYGDVLRFSTRSDHQGRDCLYTFDALRRLYDAQANQQDAKNPGNYVRLEALGQAIAWTGSTPRVVLVDEIDKAPRDFPNDLLEAIDEMKFTVRETGQSYVCTHRPIVVITSNNERQLPEPFLRRCVYHHIEFPTSEQLQRIVRAALARMKRAGARWTIDPAEIGDAFVAQLVTKFEAIRKQARTKPPATGELLAWVKVLLRAGVDAKKLEEIPGAELHLGALLKVRSDYEAVISATKSVRDSVVESRPRSKV